MVFEPQGMVFFDRFAAIFAGGTFLLTYKLTTIKLIFNECDNINRLYLHSNIQLLLKVCLVSQNIQQDFRFQCSSFDGNQICAYYFGE